MKKIKKSTGLTLALLIYVSATAAYFLPRNTEISDTEKYVTVAASDRKRTRLNSSHANESRMPSSA